MFGEDYAYAVARIRVLETGLLNQAAIEQLLACQDEQQCLQILTEKGWGNGDPAAGADAILSREREKIWEIMDSLVADGCEGKHSARGSAEYFFQRLFH